MTFNLVTNISQSSEVETYLVGRERHARLNLICTQHFFLKKSQHDLF